MKIALTEKQINSIASKLTKEMDVGEQNEPVSAEPKTGASDVQTGGDGYPEVSKWSELVGSKVSRGPANQLGNTKWSEIVGDKITRGPDNQLKENSVFNGVVTTNGRYIIILDEAFDIQEQKSLGNVWDSIDTFKTIFKNTESEEEGYQEIREGIINLPIVEGRENLHEIRDILLEFNFFNDTWLGRELKYSAEDVGKFGKDFVNKSFEAAKQIGINLDKGEWSEILKLLGKGVLYILRKLRQALFSNIGMIVEAILLATGIGKVAQMVVWALVVALDIYEISTGDFDEEMADSPAWFRYLQLGLDIMAMIIAGNAIKPIKEMFKGLKVWMSKGGKMVDWFKKTPKAKEYAEKILSSVDKAPSFLKRASSYLAKRFPKGAQFIDGILSKLANMIRNIKSVLTQVIQGASKTTKIAAKGAVAGGAIAGMNYAINPNNERTGFEDYINTKLDDAF